MKKFLALLLAILCLLSISSAAFTDEAQITESYKQAVAAMSEKGIISGFTDGTFQPKGTLTRAQAAKIICVMLGAEDKSSKAAGFTDVPTGHWAEKFVNYCAEQDIVAGLGDGTFDPNGKLTGLAFAKMLLVAHGADAVKDGLTGAGWDDNTKKLLSEQDKCKGLSLPSGEITREEACQLAYNFLNVLPEGYVEATISLKDETTLYKTHGRTYLTDCGLNVDWATAGIEFIVDCAGDISLTYDNDERGYVQVFVDGILQPRTRTASGKRTMKVAEGIDPGEHTITILRDNDISYKGLTATWQSVTFTGKKETLKAVPKKELFFEFMGASTLIGKGALVEHLGADRVYTGNDDPSHSGIAGWPYQTAKLLDADYSVIARGGAGFVKISTVPKTISQMYNYVNPFVKEPVEYDNSQRKPDAVILQCGGNDSCTKEEFMAAYKECVENIRARNGKDIPIILVYNNMVTKWNDALAEGAELYGLHAIKVTRNTQGGASKAGVTGHPSAEGHLVVAGEVAQFVREVLKLK